MDGPVDIEMAADELLEPQRPEVSAEAELDAKAPTFRVLDFLEEVFLTAASGDPVEGSLLIMARRLLEDTSDVIGILDTLRSLVSGVEGPTQQESELRKDSGNEQSAGGSAFLARRTFGCPRFSSPILSWGPRGRARRSRRLRDGRLYGLSSLGVAGGQGLLWPQDILLPGGGGAGGAPSRRQAGYRPAHPSLRGRVSCNGALFAGGAGDYGASSGGFPFTGAYPGRHQHGWSRGGVQA